MAFIQAFVIISCLTIVKSLLLFPPGSSRIQLVLGVGIPVDVKLETLIVGPFLKANYYFPTNTSQLYPSDYNRKKRSLSRWDIYHLLENEAQLRGQNDGRSCVLRAICEAAETPIDKYHGFFNELFHLIFTPTSTNENLSQHSDNEYFAAQKMGINFPGKCHLLFPHCKQTFFNRFTKLYKI